MIDVSQELRAVETKIGVKPWLGHYPEKSLETSNNIKQWLLLKGMIKQKMDNLHWDQLAKCYAIRNYYEVVAGNKPRKLNWKAERRTPNGGFLEDFEKETENEEETIEPKNETIETVHDTSYLSDTPEPSPSNNRGEIREIARTEIQREIQRSKTQIETTLSYKINDQITRVKDDLIRQFNHGEIKVSFSDQAKTELKSLVVKTANDFLAQNLPPKETVIKIPQKNININVGHVHREFPTLMTALACKLHVMLVGPASSSKTTSASLVAKALNTPFYHMGAAASDFKYSGYEDGYGKYHSTPFRMAFENGGVILLDEYDGGIPAAQMFVQAALANYTCHFPDKIIEAHPDFLCIAACNTYGRGSDRQYTSRNQQDAAALDRFVVLNWDIDEDLEAQLFGDGRKEVDPNLKPTIPDYHSTMSAGDWVRHIQKIRHAIQELGERHLVTMRASDFGARLLNAGLSLSKVEQMCVWKGLNPATVEKIKHAAQ